MARSTQESGYIRSIPSRWIGKQSGAHTKASTTSEAPSFAGDECRLGERLILSNDGGWMVFCATQLLDF